MKKIILTLVVMLLAMTACSKPAAKKAYKVGTYATTSEPKAENATAEKEGTAQYIVVIATVLLEDDVIKQVHIDEAQNKATITADGKVTVPTDTPTKHEQKDAYNMKGRSTIGKEWYKQIDAFATYLTGKKVDEVKALKVDDKGALADVASTTTIGLSDILATVVKAIDAAEAFEGEVAKIGASSSSTVKEDKGVIKFDTNLSHVVLDKDGKVLASHVDIMENEVKFNEKGELTEPTKRDSKEVRKEDYNMKGSSKIGKEWYEQAKAFEDALVGKTADEISKLEVADGKFTGDLASTVSITVTGLQASIAKSIENAIELTAEAAK